MSSPTGGVPIPIPAIVGGAETVVIPPTPFQSDDARLASPGTNVYTLDMADEKLPPPLVHADEKLPFVDVLPRQDALGLVVGATNA